MADNNNNIFGWEEKFDPDNYVGEYVYPNGQKVQKMRVQGQMMMFRKMFPKGKLRHEVTEKGGVFTATAYVYDDCGRQDHEYLACGTTSRKFNEEIKISPLEWAVTAAYGIALRNAGFGLDYIVSEADAFGDMPEYGSAPDLAELMKAPAGTPAAAPAAAKPAVPTAAPTAAKSAVPKATAKPAEKKTVAKTTALPLNVSDEEFYEALSVIVPRGKHKGKTMAEVLELDEPFVKYASETPDFPVFDAAQKIRGYQATHG